MSAAITRHLARHHVRPDGAIEDHVKKLETSVTKLASKLDSLKSRLARLESAKNDNIPRKGRGEGRGDKRTKTRMATRKDRQTGDPHGTFLFCTYQC